MLEEDGGEMNEWNGMAMAWHGTEYMYYKIISNKMLEVAQVPFPFNI